MASQKPSQLRVGFSFRPLWGRRCLPCLSAKQSLRRVRWIRELDLLITSLGLYGDVFDSDFLGRSLFVLGAMLGVVSLLVGTVSFELNRFPALLGTCLVHRHVHRGL
jgi:hypothetical protein